MQTIALTFAILSRCSLDNVDSSGIITNTLSVCCSYLMYAIEIDVSYTTRKNWNNVYDGILIVALLSKYPHYEVSSSSSRFSKLQEGEGENEREREEEFGNFKTRRISRDIANFGGRANLKFLVGLNRAVILCVRLLCATYTWNQNSPRCIRKIASIDALRIIMPIN